jgi:aspartyl-tRNA(Asn)/glutamyl-tRNA(Gln) amidotransferase subunit A
MLEHYRSPFDATVVERLRLWRSPGSADSGAGMVTLGKANCDEFAMGSSNENSYFGPVRNPWDLKAAVPGGIVGRLGCHRGRAPGACGHRHRHRRLDSPAGSVHRRDGNQADLRPGVALRHDRVRVVARSGRTDGPQRGRLRAVAQRHCGVRSARLDQPEREDEDYTRYLGQNWPARTRPNRSPACASACRKSILVPGLSAEVRALSTAP